MPHPNAELIAEFYRSFARRDAFAMAACYDAAVEFSDPVFPKLKGAQVGAMWRMLCERATDLKVEAPAQGISADDATGRAHWEAWYTFSATGRRVHNRIDARFEFRAGKVVRHTDRFGFWAWASQALGPVGVLLGWSAVVRSRVRRQAAAALARFALETPRLRLVACTPAQLLALLEQPERLETAELRAFYTSDDVSPAWVDALRRAPPGADPWRHGFFVVERESGRVIGSAGFKGPPDADGMVEIAYGVVPSCEGRGYATEAAAALVGYAAAHERVRLVRAHTLPEPNASTHVLAKCGFKNTGTVVDPEDGPVWRWEREP